MKLKRKLLCTMLFLVILICLGTIKSNAGELYLNNLEFNAQIMPDGSMDVIETWDIDIKETNTLYKSFKTDTSKYSKITNVDVKEITKGKNEKFLKTDNWAYHVKKGYYYGTENEDDNFEIGWGVGLDNSRATRKYQISYTVEDAVLKCNDYAELYWQFVGKDFEISANKIKGTILLPENVGNIDEIKVWGHTEGLNGTIYATDTDKIEFEINNFNSGRYVEIRTLFPTDLITYAGRIKNIDILNSVIEEETKWANEANARRKRNELIAKIVLILVVIVWGIVNILLIVIYIKKAIKYYKKSKELKKYIPTSKIKYYRELPDNEATPGEALKVLNEKISSFTPSNFGKVFSATMLDLSLKGYLEIKPEGKKVININILKEPNYELKSDEKYIMEFVEKAAKGKSSLTLKSLQDYIKNNSASTDELLKKSYEKTNNQLISEKIIDRDVQKEYKEYKDNQYVYMIAIIFLVCFTLIAFIIPIIIFIINAVLCGKIANKLNVLTQKGVDQKEEWKGLKKYMEDFSRLDKREVPELVIWEKYLVFATAFGIADKVIKQLKMVYPNLDDMTTGLNTFTYMNLMINTNFSSSFSNAISSSMSSAYSSGSGGGGGFSGGGGGGRWPVVAVVGR